jgi:transcriptional regulator with XRE-family HTH domain
MGSSIMASRRRQIVVTVTIPVGGNYVEELSKRLTLLDISHNALARQMGVAPSQVSRWFNRDGMSPSMKSIARIEQAVHEILEERKAAKKKK